MRSGADASGPATLRRSLGRWQLTLIGVSNAVGAGVLILAGTMAANYAGPAAALSFGIAGLACLLVALCYAELAALLPDAGSAYTYAKASVGRFLSWLVGWCLVMGYLVAGATVAVGWSGYFVALLGNFGVVLPARLLAAPIAVTPDLEVSATGALLNLPAVAIAFFCTLPLLVGVRESARLNTLLVSLKLTAIVLFIAVGAFVVDPANWQPFIPTNTGTAGQFGWSGVFAGAVLGFYAYTGFEVISASTQEAMRPERDIPFALITSFGICVLLYVVTTLVMTGIVPFAQLDHPSPMTLAIYQAGVGRGWFDVLLNMLIVVGLPSAVLVSIYGQTRIFVVMSGDRLISPAFAKIHPRFQTPLVGTVLTGLAAMVIAGMLPLEVLGELVAMGLLFCFVVVCLAVIILRRRMPMAARPFRVPFYPLVPLIGAASCTYLIFSLPVGTWVRLAVWIAIGCLIYLMYGARLARVTSKSGEQVH